MKATKYLLLSFLCSIQLHGAKIIGLIQVKNEEIFITQCLKALSLYTDAIVILDDASTDNTLEIIRSLQDECNIENIIEKKAWEDWDEPGNRNKLLTAARSIGGTHMIIMDADEMFSADCLKDNYLRKRVLSLKPGDSMACTFINLWRSIHTYRDDNSPWSPHDKIRIFCDNKVAYYPTGFLHASPIPSGLNGKYYPADDKTRGFLHFQFVNWENLLIKQAWYRCLEHIHNPQKSIGDINSTYGQSKDERNMKLKKAPARWLDYDFFDQSIFEQSEKWRKRQVNEWFIKYDKDFFKSLDIWDVNWSTN